MRASLPEFNTGDEMLKGSLFFNLMGFLFVLSNKPKENN